MTEAIRKSLRDSSLARWSALFIVAFTMLCGYFLTDIMAPLAGLLEGQLGWSRAEYGTFTSAYGWFNVFLLMLIFGGIILDKLGVRMTGLGAASVMVLGTAIKYWAVSTNSLDGQTLFGLNSQVFWASIGFAIFAIGVEVAGITVSKIIVKWFKGKELATAMGMGDGNGSYWYCMALGFSVPIAGYRSGRCFSSRIVALIGLCIGLISFIVYIMMDKKLDASEATGLVDERIRKMSLNSLILVDIGNRGWWFIAILCVLFYSAVFPFLKYATDLMVNKFGVAEDLAGLIPMLLPFGNIY